MTAELLQLPQIRQITTIPESTLRRWRSSGDERADEVGLFKLPNGRVVAYRHTVEAFMAKYAGLAS